MTNNPDKEKLLLEIEKRKIKKELGTRSTFGYTKYTFRSYDKENWHHKLISNYLQRATDRKIKRLMVFAPPRHMKSENLERAFSDDLGKRPDDKIILVGHTAGKAKKISAHIKANVTDQRHYDIYPNFPGVNGINTQDYWELGNGYRGSVLAAGRSGTITGEGFNVGGIDDLVKDRDQAESPTYHDKNFDFYASTFLSRQDDEDSIIVIVNTRWNPKDVCGRILEVYGIRSYNDLIPMRKNPETDEWDYCPEYNGDENGIWDILCLPAEMDEEFMPWKHKDDPREPGDALWPQKFSQKHLAQFKLNKHFWNSEWQQRPRPKGGNVINRAWFKLCRDFPRGGKLIRFWDLASTPKEEAKKNNPDFTAGALLTYVNGCIYIIDIVSTRLSPKTRYDLMKQTAVIDDAMYGQVFQVWEQEGGSSGPDTTSFLLDWLDEHGRAPFIEKKNKSFYIDTYIANKAETGNVYCVNGNRDEGGEYGGKWLIDKCDGNTFFDECEMWPSKTSHDDRLDAVAKCAYILIMKTIKSLFGAQTGIQEEHRPTPHNPEVEKQTDFQFYEKQLLKSKRIDDKSIKDFKVALETLEEISRKYIEKGDADMAEIILDEMDRIELIEKDKK